ncbi:MAG: aminotransferase class I/II-fold pyridoxal phosphate-dependent enzyme [Bacteroidia bacterium]|nr:aminotransferase class I/II-fold pyridoxal phosphate-dependent enzyme [Bacteroidia bacterium]
MLTQESIIDLRSDTFTKPTPAMLEALGNLNLEKLGDDVFGEDKYVNELEESTATLFGFEAGLFCPSGTMTNQIALHLHTGFGTEVICDENAHVYIYEGGGIAANSGASVRTISGNRGKFTAKQAEVLINKEDVHFPKTRVISVENTTNRGGGAVWDLEELEAISTLCKTHGLAFHMDGARIWNALIAKKHEASFYGKHVDSLSVCLSKGLGAPVGSLLLGSKDFIFNARRVRKRWGGGMRQAGILALAGKFAIDHQWARMAIDHQRAKICAEHLKQLPGIQQVLEPETNILIAEFENDNLLQAFLSHCEKQKIKLGSIGMNRIRMVFHLSISETDFEELLIRVKAFSRS